MFPVDRQKVAHNALQLTDGRAPIWGKWTPAIISNSTLKKHKANHGKWEPRRTRGLRNMNLDDLDGKYIYELGYKKPLKPKIVAVYLGRTEREEGGRLQDYLRNGAHHEDDIDRKLSCGYIIYARKAPTDTPVDDEIDLLENYCWEWNTVNQRGC